MVIPHVPRWRRLIRQNRLFTATARHSLQATTALALIAALPHSLTFVRNDKSITTLNYIIPKKIGVAHTRHPKNVIYVNINYTKPEKPIKAIASIAAVISAIGIPFNAAGTPSNSKRSRIPAKITNATAKPIAVDTE